MSSRAANLVLASGSPRRRELLRMLGLELEIRPVDLDETQRPDESPIVYVERLAGEKATADVRPGEYVLAADTCVVAGETILGKPRDEAEAGEMLRVLAGREHQVLTSVAVARSSSADGQPTVLQATESSAVRFAPMCEREITWYVATGEGLDKAGGYAVQGLGGLFIEAIEGSYTNIVGLPLRTVKLLLEEADFDPLAQMRPDRS